MTDVVYRDLFKAKSLIMAIAIFRVLRYLMF